MKKSFSLLIALFFVVSCGGGGGGDSSAPPPPPPPNYSGTWSFQGSLQINTCNLLGFPATITTNPVVNHNGNDVVVVSGTITLTGHTNDRDGFDVVGPAVADSSGCIAATSYVFYDASDGNADAGMAVAAVCGGTACAIAYGGPAVRQSFITVAKWLVTEPDSMLESLIDDCFQKTFNESINSPMESLPLDEDALKAAAIDAAKAVIGEKTFQ